MNVLPLIPYRQKYRSGFEQLYTDWRKEWENKQPEWKIENIRFEHDPEWSGKIFSLENARNEGHFVWKATSVCFWAAQGCLQGAAIAAMM